MITTYVSKPTEIEAIQWKGTHASLNFFVENNWPVRHDPFMMLDQDALELLAGKYGAQGYVPVPIGHWIVRNPADTTDYWPVDPYYFASKYEKKVTND
jgi:hypothetical protein